MVNIHGGWIAFIVIACIIVGLVAGYFISRKVFQVTLKKNPPVNEKMIRAMYMQMGRKPSEAQIKQVMRAMEEANSSGSKKKK